MTPPANQANKSKTPGALQAAKAKAARRAKQGSPPANKSVEVAPQVEGKPEPREVKADKLPPASKAKKTRGDITLADSERLNAYVLNSQVADLRDYCSIAQIGLSDALRAAIDAYLAHPKVRGAIEAMRAARKSVQ